MVINSCLLQSGPHQEQLAFNLVQMSWFSVVLGMVWLSHHHLAFNWTHETIQFVVMGAVESHWSIIFPNTIQQSCQSILLLFHNKVPQQHCLLILLPDQVFKDLKWWAFQGRLEPNGALVAWNLGWFSYAWKTCCHSHRRYDGKGLHQPLRKHLSFEATQTLNWAENYLASIKTIWCALCSFCR